MVTQPTRVVHAVEDVHVPRKRDKPAYPRICGGQHDAFKLADWEQIYNDITDSILKLK